MFTRVSTSHLSCILSLSLSFMVQILLKLRVDFTTLIHSRVHDFVLLMSCLMFSSILIHNLRALICVWSSFQFIKSFVELDISHFLLYSLMSILVNSTSWVSWSCSSTWTVSSCPVSQSFKDILSISHWRTIAVRCFSCSWIIRVLIKILWWSIWMTFLWQISVRSLVRILLILIHVAQSELLLNYSWILKPSCWVCISSRWSLHKIINDWWLMCI